jgi:ribose-phosphate pyrophosphokinase
MIDDLTETAGTLVGAADILRQFGAQDIYAGVSHAVLTPIAFERLQKSPMKELVTTDSVPLPATEGLPLTVVSIAELLAEGIKRIHEDESVTSLFEINGGSTH